MFINIIAATDMVSGIDAPVLAAIELAGKYHADLSILHVLESASMHNRQRVRHYKTNKDIMATPGYVSKVKARIEKSYKKFLTGFKKSYITIRTGYPWEEILRCSRFADVDLIVLGPHSGHAQEKGVVRTAQKIGSTVQGVIARENCPVMIVNPAGLKKQLAFKKIIVGIDFSISSECALCFSAQFSRNFGSQLFPFFMIPIPPYPKFSKEQYESNRKTQMEKLKIFCDIYLDGTNHEYVVKSGILPHLEIVKYAEKVDADLIMLGSHTKIKAGKWYAGSVVEQVSFKAGCPVIVVNDPKALHPWEDLELPSEDMPPFVNRNIHMFGDTQKPLSPSART